MTCSGGREALRKMKSADVEFVRTNGLDRPNGQQLAAWCAVMLVTVAYFSVVENLDTRWRPAA